MYRMTNRTYVKIDCKGNADYAFYHWLIGYIDWYLTGNFAVVVFLYIGKIDYVPIHMTTPIIMTKA